MQELIWPDFIVICTVLSTLHELFSNYLSSILIGFQISNDFVYESKAWNLLIKIMVGLSSISAPRQIFFKKKMTRMLRFIVPNDPLQNSSFHDTWLYQKKMYKSMSDKSKIACFYFTFVVVFFINSSRNFKAKALKFCT